MARDARAGVPRVERSPLAAAVAAGDLLVVAAVLAAGMLRHGVDPAAAPAHAALVVGPFLAGWALAAPALGAYAPAALSSPTRGGTVVAASWAVAALLGAGLRATPHLPGDSPPAFVAVVAGVGGLALVAWRGAVTIVRAPPVRARA